MSLRAAGLAGLVIAALVTGCEGLGPPTVGTLPGRELLNRIDLHARHQAQEAAIEAVLAHPAFLARVRPHLPPVIPGDDATPWSREQALLLGHAGVARLSDEALAAHWRILAVHARHVPASDCEERLRSGEPPDGGSTLRQAELEIPDDGWFAFVAAWRDAALAELSGEPAEVVVSPAQAQAAFAMVRERMGGAVDEAQWPALWPWLTRAAGQDVALWCRHERRFRDVVERLPEAERGVVMRVHLRHALGAGNPYVRRPAPGAGRSAHFSDSIRSM